MDQTEIIHNYVDGLAQETSSQSNALQELIHTFSEALSDAEGDAPPQLLDQIEELLDVELFWSKKQG